MAWTTMVVAALWVTCLGLLLEAIGFSIPLWFGYETAASAATNDKTLQSYVGSWYVMSCVDSEASSCKSEAIEPKFSDSTSSVEKIGSAFSSGTTQENIAKDASTALAMSKYWQALMLAATISIGISILSGLILICCRCAGIHSKSLFWIATVIMAVGCCGVIGTAAYGVWLVAEKFDFIQKINAARFPWSILLFGVGGLLCFIATILLFVIVCYWQRYGEYRSSDDDSLLDDEVPMSDISKTMKDRGVDNPRYADYPRDPYSDAKRGYPDRNGYGGSRKYEYYRGQERSYDRGYDRGYERDRYGYDDRSYDRQYKDRGYDRDRAYDMYSSYDRRARDANYAMSRKDNMYRPYVQRY